MVLEPMNRFSERLAVDNANQKCNERHNHDIHDALQHDLIYRAEV